MTGCQRYYNLEPDQLGEVAIQWPLDTQGLWTHKPLLLKELAQEGTRGRGQIKYV